MKGKITYEQCENAIPRLTTTTDQTDLADCDLIIEAVPEKLELKQNVFESLDKVCKPSCIFASNTSGFVIADRGLLHRSLHITDAFLVSQ